MERKANKELYSQFLLSTFGRHSAVWLSRLLKDDLSHDAITRWLSKTRLKPYIIWEYAESLVDKNSGYLILDDTVLDKWYAEDIEMVQYQYSGTHHQVVKGIGLVGLLWTDEDTSPDQAKHITVDFRIYDKKGDGKTKHHHAREMTEIAYFREFSPKAVLMDNWYAATKTLKLIDNLDWIFIASLKENRQVNLTPKQYRSVAELATFNGVLCHMKGYGKVKIFKMVRRNGDIEYLATNDLSLTAPDVRKAAIRRWKIEEYHRVAKQVTGLECCQSRNQRAQRNHILCSILAFLALEQWRLERGIPWYEAKQQLIFEALSAYLENPFIPLPAKALV